MYCLVPFDAEHLRCEEARVWWYPTSWQYAQLYGKDSCRMAGSCIRPGAEYVCMCLHAHDAGLSAHSQPQPMRVRAPVQLACVSLCLCPWCRVQLPLATIMKYKIAHIPGGACGGEYTLADKGFTFNISAIWSPLLDQATNHPDVAGAMAGAKVGGGGAGLQQLLQHSATDVPDRGQQGLAGPPAGPDGLPESKSMPTIRANKLPGV